MSHRAFDLTGKTALITGGNSGHRPWTSAPSAVYLTSDASAYHTGDTFVIDAIF